PSGPTHAARRTQLDPRRLRRIRPRGLPPRRCRRSDRNRRPARRAGTQRAAVAHRQPAAGAGAMSPGRWIAFVALLAALIAAGAGLLATRDAPEALQRDLAAAEAALRADRPAEAAAIARSVLERE